MDYNDLVQELINAYHTPLEGNRVVMIHLFGIRYAEDLAGISIKELLNDAEVPASYYPEIKKAMNLAQYVDIKENF